MKYYFCSMIKKPLLILGMLLSLFSLCEAQDIFKTADLFKTTESNTNGGTLNIIQDPSVDTLIGRYVLANRLLDGRMMGFRIQIYRSSNRNAREESNKARAEFMMEFTDIASYPFYEKPGYFIIRVGDYRTKVELTKQLYLIRKKFPNAYPVPDKINFPDLIKN
jgi:hypothetical protein